MTHILAAEGGYQSFVFSSTEKTWLVIALVTAVFGLGVGLVLMRGVLAADTGTPKMREIAAAIQEGAVAFLRRQFRAIAIIVIPLAVLIFFTATKVVEARRLHRLVVRSRRGLPGAVFPGRGPAVGPDRLHRDEPGGAGQRPHRGGGP